VVREGQLPLSLLPQQVFLQELLALGAHFGVAKLPAFSAMILKTAVGGEVLRENVEMTGRCEHPYAHLAVCGADGATD
jgi:hypothetical protein